MPRDANSELFSLEEVRRLEMKPWVQGPFELIKHADEHAKAGSDFDRRMALISFDNAIELAIVTYLSLVPIQRDNQQFPREQVEKWVKNFHTKLEFLEYLVTSIFRQPMQFERDVIVFYHGLRNDIYHRGIGVVPAENYVSEVRAVALWVFSTLFKIDGESLLAKSGGVSSVSPQDPEADAASSIGMGPEFSAQTRFLESFISMRHDINMLMRITAGENAPAVSQVGTTDAWKTLVQPQAEMDTKYEEALEQAEALRARIVAGRPVETSDSSVRELSNDLAEVSDAVRTEVQDLSAYPQRAHEVEVRLLADVPAEENKRAEGEQARWLLAQLLEWHRREEKAAWFEYFRLCELTDQELQNDKTALGGLSHIGAVGSARKSVIHRYQFPKQVYAIYGGHDVHDPRTQRGVGEIIAIDESALTIDIKRNASSQVPHPTALIPYNVISTKVLRDSLLQLGDWVVDHGLDAPGPFKAARDLLLKKSPRLRGATLKDLAGASQHSTEIAIQAALALDSTVLPIQGPPGSGKTYTGARMIAELVRHGLKVGITALNHKVISNLLDAACVASREAGMHLRAIQRVNIDDGCDDEMVKRVENFQAVADALEVDEAQVAAGSIWLWGRQEMANAVDVLFIDEAGQMSLANVLAASRAANSIVLLGDPQQLDNKGVHPPGAEVSALSHLLNGRATIGEDRGLFLSESWRLPPDICKFTSEVFYEGRLVSRPENARQRLNAQGPLDGAGLRFAPVNHSGNQSESPEEVARVVELVDGLLRGSTTWTNKRGEVAPLLLEHILVVAPYNAQVSALAKSLPAGARVGTVDKFQGQESPVVIYSMATSTPEDAPRGMEFLYSSNRLNVATSRAQCVTVLVANPGLFEVQCTTPRQIELANAFCRYLEMAKVV